LWARIAEEHSLRAWAATRSLRSPEATLAALPVLRRLARQWQREARCDQLAEAAEWFRQHPQALSDSATAAELAAAPHVSSSIADLACRVVPGDSEDPILVGYGVLRVAARFQGEAVDRQNKMSDGRLAVARMVGGDDSSHEAHLALIELANGLCGPVAPRCGECPLEPWCLEAMRRPVQSVLAITTREPKRGQAPEPAVCP
jgi:DNA (cytosine-5)-methyltransferase 1